MNSSVLSVETAALPVAHRSNRQRQLMILFVALSLSVGMSLGQYSSFERGSLQYWLLVVPALLFPLLNSRELLGALLGRAQLLLIMLVWAGGWWLVMGDPRVVMQLGALVLVLAWISTDRAEIAVQYVVRLYILLILVGVSIKLLSGFNEYYSLIPSFSDPFNNRLRVSFFPNVAYTGILSLGMLMILTSSKERAKNHPVVLAAAIYFLLFSFVRAALLASLIYVILRYVFGKYRGARPRRLFWIAVIVGLGFNLAAFLSAPILYALQDSHLVSVFLLRGMTNLSVSDILYQMYRPWLWSTHLHMLFSSPELMGWGSSYQAILDASGNQLATNGSESLPTRLLATYGIPGALFTFYLLRQLRVSASRDDRWACACFPAVFVLMMNWGSVFHPTDGMFVILTLMVTKGSAGFIDHPSHTAKL